MCLSACVRNLALYLEIEVMCHNDYSASVLCLADTFSRSLYITKQVSVLSAMLLLLTSLAVLMKCGESYSSKKGWAQSSFNYNCHDTDHVVNIAWWYGCDYTLSYISYKRVCYGPSQGPHFFPLTVDFLSLRSKEPPYVIIIMSVSDDIIYL
jgi:hypothetical protein